MHLVLCVYMCGTEFYERFPVRALATAQERARYWKAWGDTLDPDGRHVSLYRPLGGHLAEFLTF